MPESREMDSVWSEGVCTVFFGFLHPVLERQEGELILAGESLWYVRLPGVPGASLNIPGAGKKGRGSSEKQKEWKLQEAFGSEYRSWMRTPEPGGFFLYFWRRLRR